MGECKGVAGPTNRCKKVSLRKFPPDSVEKTKLKSRVKNSGSHQPLLLLVQPNNESGSFHLPQTNPPINIKIIVLGRKKIIVKSH